MPKYDIGAQIRQIVEQEKEQIQMVALQTVWAVLNRNKSLYTRKLRSLVLTEYYNAFAESEYYDRTMQFMKSAYCRPVHSEGGYGLEVGFDGASVVFLPPTKRGNFASYGSFPKTKGGDFTPLTEEQKDSLLDRLQERGHIIELFAEWFNEDFETKYNAALQQRLRALK